MLSKDKVKYYAVMAWPWLPSDFTKTECEQVYIYCKLHKIKIQYGTSIPFCNTGLSIDN